jgi:hypothetical protein
MTHQIDPGYQNLLCLGADAFGGSIPSTLTADVVRGPDVDAQPRKDRRQIPSPEGICRLICG